MTQVFVSASAPTARDAREEINLALQNAGYDERVEEKDYISESRDTDAAFAGEVFATFAIDIDDTLESVTDALRGTGISVEPVE